TVAAASDVLSYFFFFFQAEDGIRDFHVTGVQTCALPILSRTKEMGHRLSRIATRTGDDGTTGLGDGSRTGKDSLRIAAIGEVDELNSTIGLLLVEAVPDAIRDQLIAIQHDLFDLGGELCIPGFENVHEAQVAKLDAL